MFAILFRGVSGFLKHDYFAKNSASVLHVLRRVLEESIWNTLWCKNLSINFLKQNHVKEIDQTLLDYTNRNGAELKRNHIKSCQI